LAENGLAVLAFSGGLDTSVSIRWLQEKYQMDVVTCTVDVGQPENLKEIEERSKAIGAVDHYSIDAKSEFATEFVMKCIKANGLYEGKYPLSTSLARPLITSKLVDVAHKVGASTVAHGCTGKGNDQVRFDVTVKALDPSLRIVAPVREWNMTRDEEAGYAEQHGIPINKKKSTFSIDENLWGRSIESGPLEDPDAEPPEEAFEWCKSANNERDIPSYMDIEFDHGEPVSVDGNGLDPVQLIQYVNWKAGSNGVGIIDHIEDRLVGIKSREVYECPAALTLIEAHKDLEKLVLTRHELFFKTWVEQEWAWLVYSGLWVEPLREDLEMFIENTQQRVSGNVKIKLFKGAARVVGRKSENALYQHKLSTYDSTSTFDQKSAVGFIELWGLGSRLGRKTMASSLKEKLPDVEPQPPSPGREVRAETPSPAV
jgi:argininosuccinate synthase